MTGLLVADHFDQEVDEIGGLDHGAAILAIPQGRERRLAGDVDVPSARGTGVIGRDSRLSHLVDEIIHVHVDLRHNLSSTDPPDLTGFLPHPELLVDAAADSWSSASVRFRTCANFWVRRKSSAGATVRPAVPG